MGKASRNKWAAREQWPAERLLALRASKYLRDRLLAAKYGGPQVMLFSKVNDPKKW